jgi:Gpi18-like mannosyltransferase
MPRLQNKVWLEILLVYLASKVYQSVFVYWGHAVRGPAPPGGWEGVSNWLLNPWTTYDSQWYLEIAATGYREATATFFPLYPLLLRILGNSELTRALAGVIFSNLAFLLALYLLYRLTRLDFTEETARYTVWVAAFYPTAAFFGAVYTESLFFLLLLLTFYAARQRRWAAAGIWGMLAGATRNPAPVLFASLLLEYLHTLNYNIRKIKAKPVIWIAVVLLGFIFFNLYLYWRFGDPLLTVISHKYYHRAAFTWPWEPVVQDVLDLFSRKNLNPVVPLNLLFIGLFCCWALKRLFRPSYLLLTGAILLMHLCYPRVSEPHTIGLIRYLSVLFPFLQMLALNYRRVSQKTRLGGYLLATAYLLTNALFAYGFGLKSFLE